VRGWRAHRDEQQPVRPLAGGPSALGGVGHRQLPDRGPGPVQARVPLADWSDYRITVQDGVVTDASWIELVGMYGSETEYSPIPPSQAADYTIEALFNKAASGLNTRPALDLRICGTRYRVNFDETLGYITQYSVNDCSWLPICLQMSECSSSYRVTEFAVIENE